LAEEQRPQESHFLGVTVRGWIAVLLVVTVCVMSLLKIDVKEPLYTLVITAVSFYLGTKNPMTTQAKQNGA